MYFNRSYIILFLFVIKISFGQTDFFILPEDMDTIRYDYRSNGHPLEQIDNATIGTVMLRPAGGFSSHYEHHLASNLFTSPAGVSYLVDTKKITPKFTAIPYLGFQYAFGQYLNQVLNATYHHYLDKKTHLHLNYHRRGSNGILRQSDFILNNLHLLFYREKKRWKTHLDLYYTNHTYAENGGIMSSDSLINNLPIAFIEVAKQNAQSKVKQADLIWENYFSLYDDSIVSHGWVTRTNYKFQSRLFTEVGTINQYEEFFMDSTKTHDYYQTPQLSNGLGYFLASKQLKLSGTFNHKYWRYQNLGNVHDTTELFVLGQLQIGGKRLNLKNEFYINTLGALGELYNKASLYFLPMSNIELKTYLNIDNRLPIPFQRFYRANTIQWELAELNTQQLLSVGGTLKISDKQQSNKFLAGLDWTTVNNGLYMIDNQWRQDTLSFVSLGTLSLGGELHTKRFHFYPNVTLRFNTDNFSYQPSFSTRNRIAFKQGFFEEDALVIALGVDIGYDLGHDFLTYNILTSTMDPIQSNSSTPNLMRLNVFGAVEIDSFRFFVRAENVDYFINPITARVDNFYTLTPFLIRLGLTWDFFN